MRPIPARNSNRITSILSLLISPPIPPTTPVLKKGRGGTNSMISRDKIPSFSIGLCQPRPSIVKKLTEIGSRTRSTAKILPEKRSLGAKEVKFWTILAWLRKGRLKGKGNFLLFLRIKELGRSKELREFLVPKVDTINLLRKKRRKRSDPVIQNPMMRSYFRVR